MLWLSEMKVGKRAALRRVEHGRVRTCRDRRRWRPGFVVGRVEDHRMLIGMHAAVGREEAPVMSVAAGGFVEAYAAEKHRRRISRETSIA